MPALLSISQNPISGSGKINPNTSTLYPDNPKFVKRQSSHFGGCLANPWPIVMRNLTAKLTSYLFTRKPPNIQRSRHYSSTNHQSGFPDEKAMEEDAERKIGWLFKLIFAGTATIVGYNIFPYLGENLMQQSVSLLNVKDPLFKRMGASRLARFATDDERRMMIVEMGGAEKLVQMLGDAKDDSTRKEALNAIVAICWFRQSCGGSA